MKQRRHFGLSNRKDFRPTAIPPLEWRSPSTDSHELAVWFFLIGLVFTIGGLIAGIAILYLAFIA